MSNACKKLVFVQSAKVSNTKRKYMSLYTPTLDPISNQNTDNSAQKDQINVGNSNDYNLVVDMEINDAVSLSSSRPITPKEVPVNELSPLPVIDSSSFESILFAKLDICCQELDYTNKDVQQKQKEEKFKTLNEFTLYFDNSVEARKLNLNCQRAFFIMFEKNIFRSDPKFPTALETCNYTLNVVEPSWSHLIFCYQLLLRFLTLFPDAEYFNFNVVKKAIFLMQLPDANERSQLVSFIKSYYDLHPNEQELILIEIRNSLIALHSGQMIPFCMMPLLLVFSHILFRRLNQNNNNVDKQSRKTFIEGALPLIGFNYIPNQHQCLKSFFVNSLRADKNFIYIIIKAIQDKWPRQNGTKIPLALDLLITIIKLMDQKDFSRIAGNYFDFLAHQLSFCHYKTIDIIISIWTKEDFKPWITANSATAINKMYETIFVISTAHWDNTVRMRFENILKIMAEINPAEYHKMKMIVKRKQSLPLPQELTDSNEITSKWKFLSEFTSMNEKEKAEVGKTIDDYFIKYRNESDKRFLPFGFKITNSNSKNNIYRSGSLSIKAPINPKIAIPKRRIVNSSFRANKLPSGMMAMF